MFRQSGREDAEIVGRVLAGRREDFGRLVERYLPVVHALAYAGVRNAPDADDVVQETFLHALRSLDSLRDRRRFGAWLTSIARNAVNRHWNERRRTAPLQDVAEPVSETPDPGARETRERVRALVRELDPAPREVLTLHYFAGRNVREIAGLLDISQSAVKKRLQRAREALGERLLADLGTEAAVERPASDRARQVTAALLVAPVPWQALHGAPAAGGLQAALMSLAGHKIAAGVAVCAIGAGALWSGARLLPRDTAAPAEVVAQAESVEAPAAATPPPVEPVAAVAPEVVSGVASTEPELEKASFPGPCRVYGTVIDETGAPQPGIELALHYFELHALPEPAVVQLAGTSTSDGEGRFAFEGIATKRFMLVARAGEKAAFEPVDFEGSYPSHRLDCTLVLRPDMRIAGVVRDEGGNPVPNGRVRALRNWDAPFEVTEQGGTHAYIASEYFSSLEARSDALGRFAFAPRPPHAWRVWTEAPGFASTVGEPLEPEAGEVRITLSKGARLAGVTVDAEQGAPVGSVPLRLTDGTYVTFKTVSAADGRFSFEGLGATEYLIECDRGPYAVQENPLRVRPGRAPSLRVAVARGGAIAGRLYERETGKGVPDVSVIAVRPEPGGVMAAAGRAKTGGDGRYRIEGLPKGSYEIEAYPRQGYFESGTHRVKSGSSVAVELGEENAGIDLPLTRGLYVTGRVVDTEGNPVADVQVRARTLGRSAEPYYTDTRSAADGSFALSGWPGPSDRFFIQAGSEDLLGEVMGPCDLPAEGFRGLTLTVAPAAALVGRVTHKDGRPAPGATVCAKPAEGSTEAGADFTPFGEAYVIADADGRFRLSPLEGRTYFVSAAEDAQEVWQAACMTRIDVPAGIEVRGVDFVLGVQAPAGASSVSGRVTDTQGKPVARARVRVAQGETSWPGITDEQGRYSVSFVKPGPCTLQVEHDDHPPVQVEGVEAGRRDVDVVLEDYGWISGRVLSMVTGQPVQPFEVALAQAGGIVYGRPDFEAFDDPAGRFRVRADVRGPLSLIVRAPGMARTVVEIGDVPNGTEKDAAVIRLEAGHRVEGVVRDSSGAPVEGALIFRGRVPSETFRSADRADARSAVDGTFALEELAAGPQTLTVFARGTRPLLAEVQAPSREPVTLTLEPPCVLRGRVTLGGEPATAYVHILYLDNIELGTQDTQTGEDGTYVFDETAPGRVNFSVGLIRKNGHTVEIADGGDFSMERSVVIAESGDTVVDVDFPEGGATVEGNVTWNGAPAAEALVRLVMDTPEGMWRGSARTDDSGVYRIESVPEGTLRLTAFQQVGSRDSRTASATLTVAAGQTVRHDLEMGGTGAVSGHVSGIAPEEMGGVVLLKADPVETQAAAEHARAQGAAGIVEWMRSLEPAMVASGQASPDGSFRIADVQPGAYTALAIARPQAAGGDTPPVPRVVVAPVEVPAQGEATLDLALPPSEP